MPLHPKPPQQEIFMKPIAAFSMSALMLVPAMACAETSPNGASTSTHIPNTTAESSENKGEKSYPDWAAVKKIEGSSQRGASEEVSKGSQQQSDSKSESTDSSKDRPGLVEKAERIIGAITGRAPASNESAGEPRILGTLTGVIEIAPGNQADATDAVATTAAALQGRTSIPVTIKGELKIDKSMNPIEGNADTSSR
jgi:hypothetical protein